MDLPPQLEEFESKLESRTKHLNDIFHSKFMPANAQPTIGAARSALRDHQSNYECAIQETTNALNQWLKNVVITSEQAPSQSAYALSSCEIDVWLNRLILPDDEIELPISTEFREKTLDLMTLQVDLQWLNRIYQAFEKHYPSPVHHDDTALGAHCPPHSFTYGAYTPVCFG